MYLYMYIQGMADDSSQKSGTFVLYLSDTVVLQATFLSLSERKYVSHASVI